MRNRIKVLHVAETAKGGVETVIRNLIGIDAIDHVFVLPANQVCNGEVFSDSAYNFHRTGRNLRSFLGLTRQLFCALLVERPDVVHLHSSIAGVIGRLACFCLRPIIRCRVVYCPHAFSFLMESSLARRRLLAFAERVLSLMCSRVICVSKHELGEAEKWGLPKNRLSLIYNGVSVNSPPAERKRTAGAPVRLLYVGRFDHQKGVDVLCEAMKLVPSGRFELTAVGSSVHGDVETPSFPRNCRVVPWSTPLELDEIYREADVLVVPSRWEGFAMVPLEGMARGLPVIASDCASLPEVVANGVNGYLFTTGCPLALADVLGGLDPEALSGLGEGAWRVVSESFSANEMSLRMQILYHEVLGRGQATGVARDAAAPLRGEPA